MKYENSKGTEVVHSSFINREYFLLFGLVTVTFSSLCAPDYDKCALIYLLKKVCNKTTVKCNLTKN